MDVKNVQNVIFGMSAFDRYATHPDVTFFWCNYNENFTCTQKFPSQQIQIEIIWLKHNRIE